MHYTPEYKILSAHDTASLEGIVTEHLCRGYLPFGGPFMVPGNHVLSGPLAPYGGIAQAVGKPPMSPVGIVVPPSTPQAPDLRAGVAVLAPKHGPFGAVVPNQPEPRKPVVKQPRPKKGAAS